MQNARKGPFMQYADNAGPDEPAHAPAHQGLRCPLTELMKTLMYVK